MERSATAGGHKLIFFFRRSVTQSNSPSTLIHVCQLLKMTLRSRWEIQDCTQNQPRASLWCVGLPGLYLTVYCSLVGNLHAETDCNKQQALGNKHTWIFAYIIANLPLRNKHQNGLGKGNSMPTLFNLLAEREVGTLWKLGHLIEWNMSIRWLY